MNTFDDVWVDSRYSEVQVEKVWTCLGRGVEHGPCARWGGGQCQGSLQREVRGWGQVEWGDPPVDRIPDRQTSPKTSPPDNLIGRHAQVNWGSNILNLTISSKRNWTICRIWTWKCKTNKKSITSIGLFFLNLWKTKKWMKRNLVLFASLQCPQVTDTNGIGFKLYLSIAFCHNILISLFVEACPIRLEFSIFLVKYIAFKALTDVVAIWSVL